MNTNIGIEAVAMPYPDGMTGPRRFQAEVVCTSEDCGCRWAAEFIHDLGMTDYANPDDAICPVCGQPGE